MANVCEPCKRSMSSHDDHASCPQCRMAAGECHLDIENPCNICGKSTCAGGHMTGYFAGGGGGGSREGLERAGQTQCCSQIIHLAKLNPKCHMNYLDCL